ncbi:TPA: FIVAR domain-containing protein [Enterococcus faecalis]|nr:FIVAR domain-containing protein [Enterococcus faecalis]
MKKLSIKKEVIASISICAVILAGGIGYSAYNNNSEKEKPAVEEKSEKQIPKQQAKDSLFPKKSEKKEAGSIRKTVKKQSEDSNLSAFKSETINDLAQEKQQAFQMLENQVKKEQQEAKSEKTVTEDKVLPLINPTRPQLPELPEQYNKEKEGTVKPDPKPTPNPSPAPDPEPNPTPTPDPTPDPEPTPPPVIETDYSVLSTLTEQASGFDLSLYLSSGIEQFKLELLVSKRMLEEHASTQEAVNNQVSRLQAAIDNLVLKGNKKGLQATYSLSLLIKTDIFTEESVEVLKTAQSNAKQILENSEVSQQQVDEAQQQLQTAVNDLKEKEEPNLSLVYLQRLLDQALAIDTTLYTEATVTVFNEKVSEVQAYIAANDITKENNERLHEELQQAMDQLQKKADISKVQELLATINGIDRTKYTEESLANLDRVSNEVQSQLNDELSQDQVDSLYTQLETAFNQLELIPTEKTE